MSPSYFEFEVVDLDAFDILMHFIHKRFIMLPEIVTLEVLAKLAELVCFLECRSVLGDVPQMWIDKIWEAPTDMGLRRYRSMMLWVHVIATFRDYSKFDGATRRAILLARGPIRSLGLQINEDILAQMNRIRNNMLIQLITPVRKFMIRLQKGETDYSYICDCLLLGILYKTLPLPFLLPPGLATMTSIAITEALDAIGELEVPPWGAPDPLKDDDGPLVKHRGDFTHLSSVTGKACHSMRGLNLRLYVGKMAQTKFKVSQRPREPVAEPSDEPMADRPGEETIADQPGEKPVAEPSDNSMADQPGKEPMTDQPGEQPTVDQPGEETMTDQPSEAPMADRPGEADQPGAETIADPPGDEPIANWPGEEIIPCDEPMADQPSESPVGSPVYTPLSPHLSD